MLSSEENTKLANRLKRVAGQVSAIQRMVDEDLDCLDVLTQVAAARGALGKVGQIILERHIQTCVTDATQMGTKRQRQDKLDELHIILQKYIRVSD